MAKLHVNGETVELDVDDNTPLLWVLREQLGLTGTKYSCGIGRCGACTVHIDGEAVRACVVPVGSLGEAQDVVTIEGLSPDGSHPVQQAWAELDVPQCGYCQGGQVLTAAALLERNPNPGDEDIDQAMSNVLCRCGTYVRIRRAIRRAANEMREASAKEVAS